MAVWDPGWPRQHDRHGTACDAREVSPGIEVEIQERATGSGQTCARILQALPQWFGIPDSVASYVEACERTPTIVASHGSGEVGLLNVRVHTPYAAEVWVLAVLPQYHRQGIGRMLLGHAEAALARTGTEYLQVKTLSAARPDAGYAKTRAFYFACGFRPLEELPALWDEHNPALQMVKAIAR